MINDDTKSPFRLVMGAGEMETVVLPTLMLVTVRMAGKSDAVIVITLPGRAALGEAMMLAPGTE
jgi:hypothetical protein